MLYGHNKSDYIRTPDKSEVRKVTRAYQNLVLLSENLKRIFNSKKPLKRPPRSALSASKISEESAGLIKEIAEFTPKIKDLVKTQKTDRSHLILEDFQNITDNLLSFPQFVNEIIEGQSCEGTTSAYTGYDLTFSAIESIAESANDITHEIYALHKTKLKAEAAARKLEAKERKKALKNKAKEKVLPKLIEDTDKLKEDAETKALGDQQVDLNRQSTEDVFQADAAEFNESILKNPSFFGKISGDYSIYEKLAVCKSGIPLDGSGRMKSVSSILAESPELASALAEETEVPAALDTGESAEAIFGKCYNLPLSRCLNDNNTEYILPLPEGLKISTLSFLKEQGRVIKTSPIVLEQHRTGSALVKSKIPEKTVNIIYQLEDWDSAFSTKTLSLFNRQIPKSEVYQLPGEKRFIQILTEQVKDLKTRAQMIFQYLRDQGYYGSYNIQLAQMFNNSGNARDEFIAGCRTGSCVPLNWHLCRLLNQAKIPAILQFGNIPDDNERRFIADYGHAKALVLCEEGVLSFDLALAVTQDRIVNEDVLTKELYSQYQKLLQTATRRDVYKAGQELHYKILRWPSINDSQLDNGSASLETGQSFLDRTTGARDLSTDLSFFSQSGNTVNHGARNRLSASSKIPEGVKALQQAILVDNYYSDYLALIQYSLKNNSLEVLLTEYETTKPPQFNHDERLIPEKYHRYLGLQRNKLLREVIETVLQDNNASLSLKKEAATWIAKKLLKINRVNYQRLDRFPWKQLNNMNKQLYAFRPQGDPHYLTSYYYAKTLIEDSDNLNSLLKLWDPLTTKMITCLTAYTLTSVYATEGYEQKSTYIASFEKNIEQTNTFITLINYLNHEHPNLINSQIRAQLTAVIYSCIQTFIERDDESWNFRDRDKFEDSKLENAMLQIKAIAKINNENLNYYLTSHVQCLVYSNQLPFEGMNQYLIWRTSDTDSFYGYFHNQKKREVIVKRFNQILAREIHNALMQENLLEDKWQRYPLLPYEINFKGQSKAVMQTAYDTLKAIINDSGRVVNLPDSAHPGSYLHFKMGDKPESICFQNLELLAKLCGVPVDYQQLKRTIPANTKLSSAELQESEIEKLRHYEKTLKPREYYSPYSLHLISSGNSSRLFKIQYARPFIEQTLLQYSGSEFLLKIMDDANFFDPFLSELVEQANHLTDFTKTLADRLSQYENENPRFHYSFRTALTHDLAEGLGKQYTKKEAYDLSLGLREALCYAPQFNEFEEHAEWVWHILAKINQDFSSALQSRTIDQLDTDFWQQFYQNSLPEEIKSARLFGDFKNEDIAKYMTSMSSVLMIVTEGQEKSSISHYIKTFLYGFHECSVSFNLTQKIDEDVCFDQNDKTAALWHNMMLRSRWSTSWDLYSIVKEIQKLAEPKQSESRIRPLNYKRYLKESSLFSWQDHGSEEFYQYREYQSGDPLNKINWRYAARQDNHSPLLVREHRDKETLQKVLIFDLEYLSDGYSEWDSRRRKGKQQNQIIYDNFKELFKNLFLCYQESSEYPYLFIVSREYICMAYTPDEISKKLSAKKNHEHNNGSALADFTEELLKRTITVDKSMEKELRILDQEVYKSAAILSEEVPVISSKDESCGVPINSEIIAAVHSKNLNQTIPELQALAARARGSLTVLR